MRRTILIRLVLLNFMGAGCSGGQDTKRPELQSEAPKLAATSAQSEPNRLKSSIPFNASSDSSTNQAQSDLPKQAPTQPTGSVSDDPFNSESIQKSDWDDPPALKAIQSLCGFKLKTYFNCQIGSKTLSVCSYAERKFNYRYGTPSKTELSIVSPDNSRRTAFSAGSEGRLRFIHGSYDYVVYSGLYAGAWQLDGTRPRTQKAGVYVIKQGDKIADLVCDPYPVRDLDLKLLPEHTPEPFVYYETGVEETAYKSQ